MADDSIYLQQRQKEQEILKTTEQFSKKFKNVIGNLQEVNTPLAKTIADLRETTKGSFKAAANAKELQQFTTKIAKATSDSADTTTKSYQKLSEGLDRLSGTSGFLDQLKVAQDNYNQNHANAIKLEQEIAETEFKNRKSIRDFRDKIAKLELDRIRAEGLGQEDNLKKITAEKEKQEKALTKFETQIFDTKREELEIQKNLLDTSKSNLEKLNETVDKQAKEIADQDTKFTMFGQGLKELTGFDLLGTLDTVVDKVDAVGKIFGNKDLSGTIASAFSFGGKDDIIPSIAGDSQEIDPAIKIAKKELKETEEMGDDVGDIKRILLANQAKPLVVQKDDKKGGLNVFAPGALGDWLSKLSALTIGGFTIKQIFGKGGKGLLGTVVAATVVAALKDRLGDGTGEGDMLNISEDNTAPPNKKQTPENIDAANTSITADIAPITNTGTAINNALNPTSTDISDAINTTDDLVFKKDGTINQTTKGFKTFKEQLKGIENSKRYPGGKSLAMKNKALLRYLLKATGTKNVDELLKSKNLTRDVLDDAFKKYPNSTLAKTLKLGKILQTGVKTIPFITGGIDAYMDKGRQDDARERIEGAFDLDNSDGSLTFDEETTAMINSVMDANQRGSYGRGAGSTGGAIAGLAVTGRALQAFGSGPTPNHPVVKGGAYVAGAGLSYIGATLGGEIGDDLLTFDKNAQALQNEIENIAYHYQNPKSDIYKDEKMMRMMVDAAVKRYKSNIPQDSNQNGNIGGELQNQKNQEVEEKTRSGYYRNKPRSRRDKEVSSLNSFNNNITNNNTIQYGKSSFHNPDGTARELEIKYS